MADRHHGHVGFVSRLGGVHRFTFDAQHAALHDPLLGGHVVAELLGDFAKNLHQNEAWKMTHTSYIYNIYIYITIISIIYILYYICIYIILYMYYYY